MKVTEQSKANFRQKALTLISGILLCAVLFEISLRLGGFIFLSLQERRNRIAVKQKGSYRIMCLGESTTAVGEDPYPAQLEGILNQRNIDIKFSVINCGMVAVNSLSINSELEDNLNKYNPDMVTVMMGINDYGYIEYYDGISEVNTTLFNKFRTYRLIKILWMRFVNKIKKRESYNLGREKAIADSREIFSTFGLKDFYTDGMVSGQTEEKLRQALKLAPQNDNLYLGLGWCYRAQRKYSQAEESFKMALELNPRNDIAYIGLGWCFDYRGNYAQAEESFKEALKLNPGNETAYVGLGIAYRNQGKHTQSEESFKKALELNPKNDMAYVGLGWCYRAQRKYHHAEEAYKKALELNPRSYIACIELGLAYAYQRKYILAEEMFKKAAAINPKNIEAYVELGRTYIYAGKYHEAEERLKRALELGAENDRVYGSLAILYQTMGNLTLAEKYFQKADKARAADYLPKITRHSHRELKRILGKRGIKLVCVQYPMRSIQTLKNIFTLEEQASIIFVDNERVFKEAVNKANYTEYFTDLFAGDFGHCTSKGNRLLAENIANVILRECFGR